MGLLSQTLKIITSLALRFPDFQRLVETIIILANKLGIKVIATGVENEEQLVLLSQECRYAQGYYFSRPLLFNEFKKYIETQHPNKYQA